MTVTARLDNVFQMLVGVIPEPPVTYTYFQLLQMAFAAIFT